MVRVHVGGIYLHLKKIFSFFLTLFIPVDNNFQFDSLSALPFEGRCREWGEEEVLLTTDTVPACYHSYTPAYSHVTLYLRWTPPHPSGLTLSTVYSNIISGINLSPEMLTLYAVLLMNLIKFNELRSCLYSIWINSKQLIEFGSTQLFFMPGSAGNNSIDSDAELHRCTSEPRYFLSWYEYRCLDNIWRYYDILILHQHSEITFFNDSLCKSKLFYSYLLNKGTRKFHPCFVKLCMLLIRNLFFKMVAQTHAYIA